MENAGEGDTRWIRSTFRLLFAGLAALTAYAYAKQSWLLIGVVFALGAVAALALQVELHGWLTPSGNPRARPSLHATASEWERTPGDVFESWMNELPHQYDPGLFRWPLTRPVFVRLEGRALTLWETTARVPRKAIWSEEPPLKGIAPLTQCRHYELEGVKLLPEDTKKSKLWSRKYPICVQVSMVSTSQRSLPSTQASTLPVEDEEDTISAEAPHRATVATAANTFEGSPQGASEDTHSNSESDNSNENANVDNFEEAEVRLLDKLVTEEFTSNFTEEYEMNEEITSGDQRSFECSLFLFARSSHQKEEWYYRLSRALGSSNTLSEAAFGEYLAYIEPHMVGTHPYQGLNALIGRLLYDGTRSPRLKEIIKNGIQKKLEALRMPLLMERPMVNDLIFGETSVEVQRTSAPALDAAGLWVDVEIRYHGVCRVGISTRLNLLNERAAEGIGAEPELEGEDVASQEGESRVRSRNWPSFLKTLCNNRYFNAALATLSKTNIVLSVEVQSLQGVLVVNLPPPPSDRLWMGFRGVPQIRLEAVPRVGGRALRNSLVCRIVELKLRSYLEHVFVLPNMQNITLSFMGQTNS